MTTHPALDDEQQQLDRSYALLGDDAPDLPPLFGRVDDAGGSRYVGFDDVRDESGDPVVVAWHSPEAGAFYQACGTDPAGVTLKRVVTVSDRQVIAVHDEIAGGAAGDVSSAHDPRPVVGKVVVAALEQFRTGTLAEATATLRPEQYDIIRRPGRGILVIQGGPGTGKTITALHRAAWLAAHDDAVRAGGLLVVAPTPPLRSYVAEVLPRLGADAVTTDLASLYDGPARRNGRDTRPDAARVKGSAVMAMLLRRLVEAADAPAAPEELLRGLYADPSLLERLADDLLKVGQRDVLYREPAASIDDEPWTVDDLVLLDELSHLLGRAAPRYGHAVVDEAQNLSPMQARAIARRCRDVTLAGDLECSTGPGKHDDWTELTSYFASSFGQGTLGIGYRVPRPVVELSRRQLPDGGTLDVAESLRDGLGVPLVRRVEPGDEAAVALSAGEAAAGTGFKVGVVVAPARYDETLRYCQAAGIKAGDGRDGDLAQPVTVLPADLVNGLEFDAIALVEPAEIGDGTELGRRLLYVAMTRCTQSLAVFHAAPLPAGMEHLERPAPSREPEVEHRPRPARTEDLYDLFKLLRDDDRMLVEVLIRRLVRDSLERDD
ncbi:AAA family ATPase [Jiangella muralis]|uniref:AAA family ATPase n=1 Tax=Jiangella muralis TaxID=702383 RepID=UPI00069F1A4B|nr:AAA family ATPase [Jiangella muralis]